MHRNYIALFEWSKLYWKNDGLFLCNSTSFLFCAAKLSMDKCGNRVDRLSADTAYELKEYGVAVFSLYPGQVSTEGMLAYAAYDASVDLSRMETPQFIGKCVAALAQDEKAIESTGKILITAEIAEQYGFTDIDGKHPRSQRADLW